MARILWNGDIWNPWFIVEYSCGHYSGWYATLAQAQGDRRKLCPACFEEWWASMRRTHPIKEAG